MLVGFFCQRSFPIVLYERRPFLFAVKLSAFFFLFLLMCILAIALVEVLQLVTLLGSCDIDDLILNLSGMILGYLLYLIFRK